MSTFPQLTELTVAPEDADEFLIRDVSSGTDLRARFDVLFGGLARSGMQDVGDYYGLSYSAPVLPTISSNFARNNHELYEAFGNEPKSLLDVWTCTRASTATYVDATGIIREAAEDTPRVTYDPETGEPLGLLVEEQRTNLLLQSENSTETEWTQTRGWARERTAEVGSPESISGQADKLTRETSGNSNFARQYVNLTGTTGEKYTASLYVYLPSGQVSSSLECWGDFDDRDDFSPVGPIPEDTWHRVEGLTVEATADVERVDFILQLEGGETPDLPTGFTIYIYGLQLEEGSSTTSYIPTTSAQVTRKEDDFVRTLGSEFNTEEATLFVEYIYPANADFNNAASLNDSAARSTNRFLVENRNGNEVRINGGDFSETLELLVGVNGGERIKVAATFNKKDLSIKASANGNSAQTGNINDETIVFDEVVAGQNRPNLSNRLNSTIERLFIIPRALTAAELEELTK